MLSSNCTFSLTLSLHRMTNVHDDRSINTHVALKGPRMLMKHIMWTDT